VYRPKHEHFGNYVPSKIPYRYNAFIYLDETSAFTIHIKTDGNQMPETFPFDYKKNKNINLKTYNGKAKND
jgi:hypothetical protein